MIDRLFTRVTQAISVRLDAANWRFIRWTRHSTGRLAAATAVDLTRSKPGLIAENAPLRQQLIVLNRRAARPRSPPLDRFLLVILAHMVRSYRSALLIAQPDTALRWHRRGFPPPLDGAVARGYCWGLLMGVMLQPE